MLDSVDLVPERIFLPVTRSTRRVRLAHVMSDALASLLLNGVVVAFLAHVGWPLQTARPAPETIAVELVDTVPGEGTSAIPKEDHVARGGKPANGKVSEPLPLSQANPTPAAPASAPPTEPDRQPVDAREPSPPRPAMPAPLDHASEESRPRLVAAPPDPQQAPETPIAQNAAPTPMPPRTPPEGAKAPPPNPPGDLQPSPQTLPQASSQASPQILAGADSVAPPPRTSPAIAVEQHQPSAEEKQEAETTAKLAAALPLGPSFMSDAFRTAAAGQGRAAADQYRGAVYGAFRKADSIMAEAQAKHLSGQTVVAFTIDDSGALVHAAVAVSSGNAEIDRMALAIIQQSAPFPRPPPGAQHAFSPAIGFGLDQ